MSSIGGFTKTRNYVRRQKAMGRYRSPYQRGGTIFGRSIIPFFPTRARPWDRGIYQRGGNIIRQPIGPLFPARARPWDLTMQLPGMRIKAGGKRKTNQKRRKRR